MSSQNLKNLNLKLKQKNLPVFKALASDIRLQILQIIQKGPTNIQNVTDQLNISSPAVTSHIKKLHQAGLIQINKKSGKHGTQKICSLNVNKISLNLSTAADIKIEEINIPVGHYTDIEVKTPCGLASKNKIIGSFDQPQYFFDPERIKADIIWLGAGFVEYSISLEDINKTQEIKEIEISLELGSEAKGANNDWPSDLYFFINNIEIGKWISPGDFADREGKLNPDWWGKGINQYGILKTISIRQEGTFIDKDRISDVSINDLELNNKSNNIEFIMKAPESNDNSGGLTIYGQNFGDYEQDIKVKIIY